MKLIDDDYSTKLASDYPLSEDITEQHVSDMKNRSVTPETHKTRNLVYKKENLLKIVKEKFIGIVHLAKDESKYTEIIENKNNQIREFYKKSSDLKKTEHVKKTEEESKCADTDYSKDDMIDDRFYIDEYQYAKTPSSHVLHFGINNSHKFFEWQIKEFPKEEIKEALEIDIRDSKLESKSSISSKSNASKKMDKLKQIQLTVTEEELITLALEFFQLTNSKTLLVDIFVRDQEFVKFNEEKTETHTILLYNTGNKILVIDPSNPQFSWPLANFDKEIIQCSQNNKLKIYTPTGKPTGYHNDAFRDCVDIAVKIAFALNNKLKDENNIETIMKCLEIEYISNNDEINSSILDKSLFVGKELELVKSMPLRMQQSSNIVNGEKIFSLSMRLKKISLKLDEPSTKIYIKNYLTTLNDLDITESLKFESLLSLCKEASKKKIELLSAEYEKQRNEEINETNQLESKLMAHIEESSHE
jgi:hypothetical protein